MLCLVYLHNTANPAAMRHTVIAVRALVASNLTTISTKRIPTDLRPPTTKNRFTADPEGKVYS